MILLESPAIFSPCRRYRYLLRRDVGPGSLVCLFIMLNPSTADEVENDPTINRDISFALAWGCGILLVVNLFAFRATDPKNMKHPTVEPVGTENDRYILEAARAADIRVAAWGNHGSYGGRSRYVRAMLQREGLALHYLRLTKQGEPQHPLYIPASQELMLWAA